MSEAGKPAARSDLPTRFAAGVAMIAVALLVTWLGGWPFRVLAALAAALMLVEWADMHRVPRLWALVGGGLLAASLLVGLMLVGMSPEKEVVEHLAVPAEIMFDDAHPSYWTYQQALARSPQELDAILQRHARLSTAAPSAARNHFFIRSDAELSLHGEL